MSGVLLIGKYDESMSTIIQRSMSERTREKCLRLHIGGGHPIIECSHRVARRMCRHAGSRLRHQARLEYVQSTPNVATMHNGKHVPVNPRDGSGDVNGNVSLDQVSVQHLKFVEWPEMYTERKNSSVIPKRTRKAGNSLRSRNSNDLANL